MASGWVLADDRLAEASDEDRARLRHHLAEGSLLPALVVRLDPLVIACPDGDASVFLLMVEYPADAAMIRRCRLRMDSRLSAIVHAGVPLIGELVGDGPPAEAEEPVWKSIQERAEIEVRSHGWMVRSANPLITETVPELMDRMVPPTVVIEEYDVPPARPQSRLGWLFFGILLVILLKLLVTAWRDRF